MKIVIDIDAPIPLFTQLVNQIKHAVANKKLKPGDPLPSIRQLANDLEINNKTVAKAYRLLERDSIIQAKGYRGTFVHPNAEQHCAFDLNSLVIKTLTEAVESIKQLGATDSEIRIAFNSVINNSNKKQ